MSKLNTLRGIHPKRTWPPNPYLYSGTLLASGEPIGFLNRTTSVLSWDNGLLKMTITPTVAGVPFMVYQGAKSWAKIAAESKVIANTEGLHYIYYDGNGVLQETATWNDNLITVYPLVAAVRWNATAGTMVMFLDERHGIIMDSATHLLEHITEGARYRSDLSLTSITPDLTGGLATDAQLGVTAGMFFDDDDLFSPAIRPVPASIKVLYREGVGGPWRANPATVYPMCYPGSPAGYVGATVPYNKNTAGTWSLTAVTAGRYVLLHFFVTNGLTAAGAEDSWIVIQGQNEYNSVTAARNGANVEIASLKLDGLPLPEMLAIGTVIVQTDNGYANVPKARIRTTDLGASYVDWRGQNLLSSSATISDHGALTNLSWPLSGHNNNPAGVVDGYKIPAFNDVGGAVAIRSGLGSTIYVDDGASTVQNGSFAFPYHDLQSAINASVAGDQILVGAGTYIITATTLLTTAGKAGVSIVGGGAGWQNATAGATSFKLSEAGKILTVSTNGWEFRNIKFLVDTAVTAHLPTISGSNVRFVDCYFEVAQNSTAPSLTVTGGTCRFERCTFNQTASVSALYTQSGGTVSLIYCEFILGTVVQSSSVLLIVGGDFQLVNLSGTAGFTATNAKLGAVTSSSSGTLIFRNCEIIGTTTGFSFTAAPNAASIIDDCLLYGSSSDIAVSTGVTVVLAAFANNTMSGGKIVPAGTGKIRSAANRCLYALGTLNAFATIQGAIASAVDGDTVLVAPGTIALTNTTVQPLLTTPVTGIKLKGAGCGGNDITATGGGTTITLDVAGTALTISQANWEIEDIRFVVGTANTALLPSIQAAANNTKFTNCVFISSFADDANALHIAGAVPAVFESCVFAGGAAANHSLHLTGAGTCIFDHCQNLRGIATLGGSGTCSFYHADFRGGSRAFNITEAGVVNIYHSDLVGADYGIACYNYALTVNAWHSHIEGIAAHGINVVDLPALKLFNCDIKGGINGIQFDGAPANTSKIELCDIYGVAADISVANAVAVVLATYQGVTLAGCKVVLTGTGTLSCLRNRINDLGQIQSGFANVAAAEAYIATQTWTKKIGWSYWDTTELVIKVWDGVQWTVPYRPLVAGDRITITNADQLLANPIIAVENPMLYVNFIDEFVGGNIVSGSIGDLGWNITGTGTVAMIAAETNHPGMRDFVNAGNAASSLALEGRFNWGETDYIEFVFKTNATMTLDHFSVGFADALASETPTNGIILEHRGDAGDLHWYVRGYVGGAETSIDTTIHATASTWFCVRFTRNVDATWTVIVNGVAQAPMAAVNLPADTVDASPCFRLMDAGGLTQSVYPDYMRYKSIALSARY